MFALALGLVALFVIGTSVALIAFLHVAVKPLEDTSDCDTDWDDDIIITPEIEALLRGASVANAQSDGRLNVSSSFHDRSE